MLFFRGAGYFITAAEKKLGHASYIYDLDIIRFGRQTAGGSISEREKGPRVPEDEAQESYARGHSKTSSVSALDCVTRRAGEAEVRKGCTGLPTTMPSSQSS